MYLFVAQVQKNIESQLTIEIGYESSELRINYMFLTIISRDLHARPFSAPIASKYITYMFDALIPVIIMTGIACGVAVAVIVAVPKRIRILWQTQA